MLSDFLFNAPISYAVFDIKIVYNLNYCVI